MLFRSNKPVLSLDAVITEIMDVIWIEDLIEYEKVKDGNLNKPVQTTLISGEPEKHGSGVITKSTIMVVNYKRKPQKFNLYVLIPEDAVVGMVEPKPVKISDKYIKWDLGVIPSANKVVISFELAGLEEGDFDENDIYTEDINPSFVIGADKWEGD